MFSASEYVLREIPVLKLAGDIDLAVTSDFRATVETVLRHRAPLVVVDLADVDFFDSSGLKVLDEAQDVARAQGSRMALACPPGRIMRLFEITGLDERFDIHQSAEHAAAADSD